MFLCKCIITGLKSKKRIVEKVEKEYAGKYSKVVDIVRASAVFDNAADLARLVASLSDDGATEVKVVRVKDREEIPADIVCLASSDSEGKCYIETANIDGETNLKLRKCAACNAAG